MDCSKELRTRRPIMVLLDLLGRRWTLRIVWELREQPLSFRALRANCEEVSPSVLNARLKDLRSAGIVELRPTGYGLTASGRELLKAYHPLGLWADGWARDLGSGA